MPNKDMFCILNSDIVIRAKDCETIVEEKIGFRQKLIKKHMKSSNHRPCLKFKQYNCYSSGKIGCLKFVSIFRVNR